MYPTCRSVMTVLVIIAALTSCSDPVSSDGKVFGGPDNPAPDGSYTQAIVSTNGIASLEPVLLGGVEQWILVRGCDTEHPVLIYLHGGPGSPAIPYGRIAFGGLEEDFTVVTWDQRDCGESYASGISAASITLDQLLSDTHDLILLMTERFSVDSVYLMGASWGSVLGVFTARDHPELVEAYIGVGQFIDAIRTMRLAHAAVLDRATELEDQPAIEELSPIQLYPEIEWDKWGVVVRWLETYGFGDLHDTSQYSVLLTQLLAAPEYTSQDFAHQEDWEELYWASPLNAGHGWVYGLDIPAAVPVEEREAFSSFMINTVLVDPEG